MSFLFTKSGEPPWEFISLKLCREIYHCLPSQLGEEDWAEIEYHLYLLGVEAEVQQFQRDSKKK